MRDIIQVKKGKRLLDLDPVGYLWQYQWDRMSCHPGLPGWQLNKFHIDSVPWHKSRLVILLDIEPNGKGIRFKQTTNQGHFWSSSGFLKRNGFSFYFSHEDYTVEALNIWFELSTDGDWDKVFSRARK